MAPLCNSGLAAESQGGAGRWRITAPHYTQPLAAELPSGWLRWSGLPEVPGSKINDQWLEFAGTQPPQLSTSSAPAPGALDLSQYLPGSSRWSELARPGSPGIYLGGAGFGRQPGSAAYENTPLGLQGLAGENVAKHLAGRSRQVAKVYCCGPA